MSNMLPILELDELIAIFEYTNKRAAKRAIKRGSFPVPIFRMAGRTVAHVDAVQLYFAERRAESMTWLKRHYGIEDNAQLPTEPRLEEYRRLAQKGPADQ